MTDWSELPAKERVAEAEKRVAELQEGLDRARALLRKAIAHSHSLTFEVVGQISAFLDEYQ